MAIRSALFTGFLLITSSVSAHGGMQKFVDGTYVLNMSSSPIAPRVGQEQQNIIALSDAQTNELLELDSTFEIEIRKGDERVHQETGLIAEGGLLQFNYTYPEAGLYEFFVKFALPGEQRVYAPEDFWVQVLPAIVQAKDDDDDDDDSSMAKGIAIGIAMGLAIGSAMHWKKTR